MSFNFMAANTTCSDFGALKIKSAIVSPSICYEVMAWSGEWPRGDTPHPRSGAVAALRWTSCVEIPQVQGQRNPSEMVGAGAAVRRYSTCKGKGEAPASSRRGESVFRIKPHSRQRCLEVSNETCVHQDPGTPERLRQNCV